MHDDKRISALKYSVVFVGFSCLCGGLIHWLSATAVVVVSAIETACVLADAGEDKNNEHHQTEDECKCVDSLHVFMV